MLCAWLPLLAVLYFRILASYCRSHGCRTRHEPSAPGCIPLTAGITRFTLLAPGCVPTAAGVHCFVIVCAELLYGIFLRSALQCLWYLIATPPTLRLLMPLSWTLLPNFWTQNWHLCAQSRKWSAIGVVPVPLVYQLVGNLEGLGIASIYSLTGRIIISVRPWTPTWAQMNGNQANIL